ncbi:MAG: substrate-binding domain-containing protein [Puniceicoccaceae bacterium]
MKATNCRLKFLLGLLILSFVPSLFGEVVVVVNADSPVTSISRETLKNILSGKEKFWSDGSNIELAVPSGNALEAEVLKEFAGMDATRFKTHWRRLVFSGRAKNPSECKDDASMLELVSDKDNALGFVSAGADTSSVKKIEVTD